ncbi:hypothetical protein [Sphingomonas corticis]|jgi:hypothetical protein|nr:hypothetical protein [Sphingomonas corticis]
MREPSRMPIAAKDGLLRGMMVAAPFSACLWLALVQVLLKL